MGILGGLFLISREVRQCPATGFPCLQKVRCIFALSAVINLAVSAAARPLCGVPCLPPCFPLPVKVNEPLRASCAVCLASGPVLGSLRLCRPDLISFSSFAGCLCCLFSSVKDLQAIIYRAKGLMLFFPVPVYSADLKQGVIVSGPRG